MLIIDIPNWIMLVSWFVVLNFSLIVILILWIIFLNKRDMRKENKRLS
tara:strand:+ start:1578 stop:1721 length:144 start_codon:yes stop_codon:yes gene_type:complete